MVTYVVVAACAGSGSGYRGGGATDAATRLDSTLFDAVTNPVPDAMAGPQVSTTEPCLSGPNSMAVASTTYATHLFPGKTVADLAGVLAVGHLAGSQSAYPYYQTVAFLADGSAAVACNVGFDSVLFVLP